MEALFVVGTWEHHVNDLDEELVKDMEEYMPVLAKEAFDHVPPLRTIPVGKSIDAWGKKRKHDFSGDKDS